MTRGDTWSLGVDVVADMAVTWTPQRLNDDEALMTIGLGDWRLSGDGRGAQLGKHDSGNTVTRSNLVGDDYSDNSDKFGGRAARLDAVMAMQGSSEDDCMHIM